MLQFDASSLTPVSIAALIVLALILSSVTGALADYGWRKRAKNDLELSKIVGELADCDEDAKLAEDLKQSALNGIRKGRARPFKILEAAISIPLTVSYSCILLFCLAMRTRIGYEAFLLIPAVFAFDMFNLYVSKRPKRDSEGSEHHREAEVGQDEDDAVDDDSHREILP